MPKIEKRKVDKDKVEEMVDVDLEGGPGNDEKTTEEILKVLPVLFLLNKNDKAEFKGVE